MRHLVLVQEDCGLDGLVLLSAQDADVVPERVLGGGWPVI